MTESYRCWAEVDLHALRENLAQIRALVGPDRRILTVVKADAYGHGLRQIAAVLMQSGTDVFGVANLQEARAIRTVGKGWPILMLGACLPCEVDLAIREGVMVTISSMEEARLFSAAALAQHEVALVQVKVDTGMGRLGVAPDEAVELFRAVQHLPGIRITGLYTHYSSAEDDAEFTARQEQVFSGLIGALATQAPPLPWIHASNSAGLLLQSAGGCNTARVGLLVYGIVPKGRREIGSTVGERFRPALSWKSRVSHVKTIAAGTPISYGHTFVSPRSMRVATITAGYGDGYLRAASNRAQVLVGGTRCAVLGRVTMDQMVVDVSGLAQVGPGDEVVLIGRQGAAQITTDELAGWCDSISWEVLTNITYRVPRLYRGGQAA